METLIKYLAGEGRVILQAPATFLIAIAIVAGLIWAAMSWSYSSQITNLQSRLSLRDDQISDYKSKLDGATPAEARKRLDDLENQVKVLSARRLTTQQKEKIAKALAGAVGVIDIAHDMAAADAKAYTGDFALAFRSAGWIVSLPAALGISNPPATGIGLRVRNPAALTTAELVVKRALEAAEIGFDIQKELRPSRPNPTNPTGAPTMPPEPDVSILLTTKLD
jgi:hypothetical protein